MKVKQKINNVDQTLKGAFHQISFFFMYIRGMSVENKTLWNRILIFISQDPIIGQTIYQA